MATLIKLQISGIRSFGPLEEHLQQISFDTPVTLIVGQNGCGKTTILEAIKYACTGDLPGGTLRGQGFVHDPKISEMAVTKGQIKLKLIDIRGDTYTIAKSVQLQQRASTMSFSSLDSALSIIRSTGEKQQITGRCADIDKHCSQVLQVSPCIINNVLFCHQENSSWPLDEGKKVKEKFDEIFDSKKYNKCGEALTKTLKTKLDNIKLLKNQIENLEDKKNEVSKKKEKLQERESKRDSIVENIQKKSEIIDPHKNRLKEIEGLEVDIGRLQEELTTKKAEKKGVVQQQNMLKQNISTLFEGTDEELQSEIISFEETQKEKERIIEALEENKKEIEKKENFTEGDIQKTQIKLGQLREAKKQFEIKNSEQSHLFKKAKVSFVLPELFTWNTVDDCLSALNTLKLKLKEADENLDSIIKSKTMEQSIVQEKIDHVREALATVKQKFLSTETEIENSEKRQLQITNEILELDIGNNKLVEIDNQIAGLVKFLENLQRNYSETDAEAEIMNTKKEIANMEERIENFEKDYKILQHNHIIDEKLSAEEQRRILKKTESNKLKTKHASKFQQIFKNDIPNDRLGKKLQAIIDSDENEIKEINTKITTTQRKITTLETQIECQNLDIKKTEEELNLKKSDINAVCQEKKFSILLEEVYEKKERLQKEKGQLSSGKIIYEKFIEVFQEEKPCCPICDTDFSDKKIVKNIINNLQQKIKTLPQKLMITEQNLKKEENLYNKLQQLKPVNENIEVISNVKLPLLHEQLETFVNELSSLKNELSVFNKDLQISTKKLDICRSVLADATLLDQYNSEVNICEENIKDLTNKKIVLETLQNIHEVESEIENLKADLNGKRRAFESIRQKLDQHKQRIFKNNEKKSELMEMQMKYQNQANKKPQLEEQLRTLKDDYSVLLMVKEEQKSEHEKLDNKLKNLNIEKSDLISNNNDIISHERAANSAKHRLVDDLIKINCEINRYQDKNLDQILQQTVEQLTKLEEKKKDFNDVKSKAIKKITEQKEEIAKQATLLRNLKDNTILRDKQKLESSLMLEITNLETKIGGYNYQSIYEEKNKVKKEIEKIEKEINSLKGQEMELKNTICDMTQDLNLPSNKNAEKNYKEKFYELKITEEVVDDLKIYTKALQSSILQFHKERMVQINERIRELWRNIYKGNDIDYIQINAEEGKGNATSKQTYDYKVVQIKNGIELEMRGRCSAGQRVLACLIIRMALAESFSPHCGILALDEPTTNLDRENVTSLAYALSNIITSHENDNNFQLLVITHDQEFLNVLRHSVQNISYYWRVNRDPQGYSVIKKERL